MSLVLFCAGLNVSCTWLDREEPIPAYLRIDTFTYQVAIGQGSPSQRITDVWLFDDVQIIGAFELPKSIPLLYSGATQLTFSAGIWDNGISEVRIPYPFYQPYTATVVLTPGEETRVQPMFTYRSSTRFLFIEDFEAGNLFEQTDGSAVLERQQGEVFEGAHSAAIYLDTTRKAFVGQTAAMYTLSHNQPVYLELDYKCSQRFEVGLLGIKSGINTFYYKWNVNPKPVWNKIYLNLGPDVTAMKADSYRVLIRAVWDSTQNKMTSVFLDNIKLITF